MNRTQLDEILQAGEGQHVEFKESLKLEREGTESMVAFANGQGGSVLFGVQNDGTVRGIQIGDNTLENLANYIKDHTYPSLSAFIEHLDYDGKHVVIADVAQDVPPIIGVYLYSSHTIPADSPVDASRLQAYRRVGRTNQKEDFMRMRAALPSDPRLRIGTRKVSLHEERPERSSFKARVWTEQGSATAHDVTLRLDPPACEWSDRYPDLPFPGHGTAGYELRFLAEFANDRVSVLAHWPANVRVVARYKDDWELTWESTRRFDVSVYGEPGRREAELVDAGEFTRRIVRFPPKAQ